MHKLVFRFINVCIRNPKTTVATWLILATIAMAVIVPRIQLDPTFKNMIVAKDPDIAFDLEMKKQFGDDELLVIGIHNDEGVFTAGTLQRVDRLTRAIQELDGVRDIFSLTHMSNIRGQAGTLDVRDLIEPAEVPTTDEEAQAVERIAADNPVYTGTIVSEDKKTTAIGVEFDVNDYATGPKREALIAAIYKVYQTEEEKAQGSPDKMYITGFPITEYKSATYMIEDMVVFAGVSTVLLIVIIYWTLRNFTGVLATLMAAMMGVTFTYFLIVATGNKISMPLSAVMTFIMAIGMQYAIYGIYAYVEEHNLAVEEGRPADNKTALISSGMNKIITPLLAATATTIIGFFSQGTNAIPELGKMGLFLGLGVLFLAVTAVSLVPALLVLLPYRIRPEVTQNRLTTAVVARLRDSALRRPWVHIAIGITVAIISIVGMSRISTDSDAIQYFKKSEEVRIGEEFLRGELGGTTYLKAVLTAEPESFKDPAVLQKVLDFQRFAETQPNVVKTISLGDYMKLINWALHDQSPNEYKLLPTREAVEQALTLHSKPQDFRTVVSEDYSKLNVVIRMNTMSSATLKLVESRLENYVTEKMAGMQGNVVGTTLLVHRSFDEMANSMLLSLFTALIPIMIVMMFVFRSIKMGLIAICPNVLPIMMNYALLGFIGRPLDPPAAVTGAIALGIAVDDTIHCFQTWKRHADEGMKSADAVRAMLDEFGRPMVMSSVVLAFGFGVMVLSRYGTLQWMAIMLAVSMMNALLCDLVLTPAILRLIKTPADRGIVPAAVRAAHAGK